MSSDRYFVFEFIAVIVTLLGIQLLFGKKASFPYGILMGLSPLTIGVIVVLSDFGLIFFVRFLANNFMRFKWFKVIRDRFFINEQKVEQSRWLLYLQNLGRLGVVVVVATPLAGGVWSGSILSKMLGLKDLESFGLIALGTVIGCAIFVLGFQGIISWMN